MKNKLSEENKVWRDYIHSKRGVELKKEIRSYPSIQRIEKRFRLKKARSVGYKALRGYIVYLVRVSTGGMDRSMRVKGRRTKRYYSKQHTLKQNSLTTAVRRLLKTHKNLAYIKGYPVFRDGKHVWYEVITVVREEEAVFLKNRDLSLKFNKSKVFRKKL